MAPRAWSAASCGRATRTIGRLAMARKLGDRRRVGRKGVVVGDAGRIEHIDLVDRERLDDGECGLKGRGSRPR